MLTLWRGKTMKLMMNMEKIDAHKFVRYAHDADITKEVLEQLPKASYLGKIVLVSSVPACDEAVQDLMRYSVLGFDTESKPSFYPGGKTGIALLQIASPYTCYLFRVNRIGIPETLKALIEDERILKVGLALQGDLVGLKRLKEMLPQGFVEIQNLVPAYGIRSRSLQKIYGIVKQSYMSKKQRMTNWEARQLSIAQQNYAALDAYACLEIYEYLMALPVPQPTQFGLIDL